MSLVRLVYEMFKLVFGPGLGDMVGTFLGTILSAAADIMNTGAVTAAMGTFTAVGASLITLYFFMDALEQASSDLLTLERLMKMFIQLLIAFSLVLYIPEISEGIFSFGAIFCQETLTLTDNENTTSGSSGGKELTYWGWKAEELPDWDDDTKNSEGKTIQEIFTDKEDGLYPDKLISIKSTINAMGTIIVLGIPAFACLVAAGLSMLVCITQVLSFFVYVLFAPVAVSQCFGQGRQNGAMRYIKKMLAQMLALAAIAGILWAVNKLQSGLVIRLITGNEGLFFDGGSKLAVTNANFFKLVSLSNFGFLLITAIIQCSAAGAISKAPQIANDIVNSY